MKQPSYLQTFNTKAAALEWGRLKNRANRVHNWNWVVVDGPEDHTWCVVDIDTAIELDIGYVWFPARRPV